MTGLSPEATTLGIALGVVFALICYLATNLSPGGMITPGWGAVVLVENPRHILLIGVTVVLTFVIVRALDRIVILYGKRLFATVVLVAVFIQITGFLLLLGRLPFLFDDTTLGFIVPGLIAYQLLRQPVLPTLAAIAAVSAVTYGLLLAGVELGFVRLGSAGAVESLGFTRGRILLSVGIALVGLILVVATGRRAARAPHP